MRYALPMSCLFVLLLAACPGDGNGNGGSGGGSAPVAPAAVIGPAPGGTADPDGGGAVALTINGAVTYDRLPVTPSGLGAAPVVEDAVEVVVEAVAHDDINNVLAATATGTGGAYTLNFSTTVDYYIRARAESGAGGDVDRVYHSQTAPPVVHAAPGAILNRAAGSQTVDIHAACDLPDNRAGAFAILDTVRRLRASVSGSFASLGPLDLFWGIGNDGTQFLQDGGGGTITLTTETSLNGPHGNPSIYLLGGDSDPLNSDHDEFDETVIAHEWASFLQLTRSRDNNFGGRHAGEKLIFSAAYSEGVVTAIGNALLGERVYRDTTGWPTATTSVQFEFDCESGVVPGSGSGYASEFEVTRAVWDLLDGGTGWPADNDGDPAAIDMNDFFSSFAALKTRGAPYEVAWTASLLQQLIDDGHLTQGDADNIMTAQGAAFPPTGGDSFPAPLTVGTPESDTLDAWSGTDPNPILGPQANGVYRLELASAQGVTLDLDNTTPAYDPGAHRLDLTVHALDRTILGEDAGDTEDKSLTLNLAAGTYIIRVQHRPGSQAESAPTNFTLTAQ